MEELEEVLENFEIKSMKRNFYTIPPEKPAIRSEPQVRLALAIFQQAFVDHVNGDKEATLFLTKRGDDFEFWAEQAGIDPVVLGENFDRAFLQLEVKGSFLNEKHSKAMLKAKSKRNGDEHSAMKKVVNV